MIFYLRNNLISITLIVFISLLFVVNLSGQSLKPIQANLDIANNYKTIYPKEDYVSVNCEEVYTFEYDKKTNKVKGICTYEESLICLKEINNDFYKSIFFDDQSEITYLRGFNYKNKSLYLKEEINNYNSQGIYFDDLKLLRFSFSFDRIGDKKSYRYNKEYFDIKYMTRSTFHDIYPIISKKIQYVIPSWLSIELIETNFSEYNISRSDSINTKGDKIITYTISDMRPIKNNILSSSHFVSLPHILIISKEFDQKGKKNKILESTDDLYNWYHSLVTSVKNEPEVFQSKVIELTSNAVSEEEKIENIFFWIQDNIRYLAYEDGIMGFKPSSAQDVFTNKYGDCKGMANLTSEMLKLAGFDARLTWTGTRSIPYNYDTPSLAVDNHMITTVFHNNKKYYLDATETGICLNDYAHRIQGQDVLIENGTGYIIDTIPNFSPDHNTLKTDINLELLNDTLSGTGTQIYHGEEKKMTFSSLMDVPKLKRENHIKSKISYNDKDVKIFNVVTSDISNRRIPFVINYGIVIINQVTSFNNEVYLNSDFKKEFSNLEIDTMRINDLDFGYKVFIDTRIKIKLPNGYEIEYLPETVNIETEEYLILLEMKFLPELNSILYTKNLIIKTGMIKAKGIKKWNNSIYRITEFYGDQIILQKQI